MKIAKPYPFVDSNIYWFSCHRKTKPSHEYHIEAASLEEARERFRAITIGNDFERVSQMTETWADYAYRLAGDWEPEDPEKVGYYWRIVLNLDDGRVYYRYV